MQKSEILPWKHPEYAPASNFAHGFAGLDEIQGLGSPYRRGKVRDIWELPERNELIIVATDRQSAYDKQTSLTPGKGAVLTGLSSFWFDQTASIMPNHMIYQIHPNVMVVEQALEMFPVEWVLRNCLSESGSNTSVWKHYADGKRNIYGIDFPDGLVANQFFEGGPIFTPTTKGAEHDQMLTEAEAMEMVIETCRPFGNIGEHIWNLTKLQTSLVFDYMTQHARKHGLILADTKFEIGLTQSFDGHIVPMLCDEIGTPDSSRLWLADSYVERMNEAQPPEAFDKEILRRWLRENGGFTGDGDVPVIPYKVISGLAEAYRVPAAMLLGYEITPGEVDTEELLMDIRDYLNA